ncbi:MAG: hypothetical protein NT033_02565 [Candidatus Omnitrophica bacterium]|nr:hypothetical protein [Candidatus Omnitrophota bacterium]
MCTYCNVPLAPNLTTLSTSGINVVINENSNPSRSTFAIKFNNGVTDQYVQANKTLGASPVYQDKTTWGTIDVTGLASNTQYAVSVSAKNNCAVSTAYGPTASTWTWGANADVLEASTPDVRLVSTYYEGDNFVFTFGSHNLDIHSINKYKYIWDDLPDTSASSSSAEWTSGSLTVPNGTFTATNGRTLYLHVLGYNAASIPNTEGTKHYGPYYHVETRNKLKHDKWFEETGTLIEMGPKLAQ